MIKVEKDLNNVPSSLNTKPETLTGHDRRKATTTHARRLEVISAKKYIDEENYNSRYKVQDIRNNLEDIYNGKCAYCETKVEQYHIDHYRPKSIYYWLAYSWDNLIIACQKCNEHKNNLFDIDSQRAKFRKRINKLNDINKISIRYDRYERPKLINLEIFDPYLYLTFSRNGMISSNNANVNYTIELCKINRKWLNDARRKIIEDFAKNLEVEITLHNSIEEQYMAAKVLVRNFIQDSKNKRNQYLAFRKFHIDNKILEEIIKEKLP
ncbi:TIGR02646 family protein [Acinetobacter baumannii]|uniref:retron system putative HNH endonuclease n=1 Tax=Acinetobacter baumannii TaxID=470 RepID=UPI00233FE35C|nr:retron system putative HNH endonuclease [Acinetobacter baumannii]MDC5006486.1 TIGR02646 family protein [Acinetobacter baumannii]MDH2619498.1 TIGR02646 family protein [Acinetobacter baumannii]